MRKSTVFGGRSHPNITPNHLPANLCFLIVLLSFTIPALAQVTPTAWVVNSLGETLSEIDLTSGQVTVNSVTLGSTPNDIAIRDNAAFVVNSVSNNVQIVDLETAQTTSTIEIYQGLNPYFIALEGDERAFVSNLMTGNVSVLDLASSTETTVLQTGGTPEGICVTEDYLYVTDINYTGTFGPGHIYAFSLETLELIDSANVAVNPQVVKLGPDGNLHIVCTGNFFDIPGQIDIVDPISLNIEESIPLGGSPGSLCFNSTGIAFVGAAGWGADGFVYAYNAQTYEVIFDNQNPITVPSAAMGITVTSSDQVLVCCFSTDELAELDSNGNLIRTFQVGDGPVAVAVQELLAAIEPWNELEMRHRLSYNFPEPFNAETTVVFSLQSPQPVELKVYNASGRLVAKSYLGIRQVGENALSFRPNSDLCSGKYWYQLETQSEPITGSMLYLK